MNSIFHKMPLFLSKRAKVDKNESREQRVIKLNDNTYQVVWADEYSKWVSYLKGTGKLK